MYNYIIFIAFQSMTERVDLDSKKSDGMAKYN